MNKVAFVEGNVDRQFALDEAATVIAHHVRRLRGRSGRLSRDRSIRHKVRKANCETMLWVTHGVGCLETLRTVRMVRQLHH